MYRLSFSYSLKLYIKYLLAFIIFILLSNSVLAEEFERLYVLKNIKSNEIKYIADFYSRQQNYSVITKDNYTYVKKFPSQSYYLMSFFQINDDTEFYIYSTDSQKEVIKNTRNKFGY